MKKRTRTIVWLAATVGVLAFFAALLYPILHSSHVAARKTVALSYLKQLSNAWQMYASDNNDKSCGTKTWNQDIARYCSAPIEELLRNPMVTGGSDQRNFGMNMQVGLIDLSIQDPDLKLVVFATTSTTGANALVSESTLAPASGQTPQFMYAGVEGFVRFQGQSERAKLSWQPVRAKH